MATKHQHIFRGLKIIIIIAQDQVKQISMTTNFKHKVGVATARHTLGPSAPGGMNSTPSFYTSLSELPHSLKRGVFWSSLAPKYRPDAKEGTEWHKALDALFTVQGDTIHLEKLGS